VSGDRYRWAELAQELRFHQLEAVRKQAETWRTGLTGLTALFGAVLVLRGRENVADLTAQYRALIVALLLSALVALVVATLSALRAASGAPGDECLLTGEDLEAWTRQETAEAQRSIRRARRLTLVGAGAMAVAVGLAWLAPRETRQPTVVVQSVDGRTCGSLSAITGGAVAVQQGKNLRIIPLGRISRLEYAERCPP
jgi:hypothetical protein